MTTGGVAMRANVSGRRSRSIAGRRGVHPRGLAWTPRRCARGIGKVVSLLVAASIACIEPPTAPTAPPPEDRPTTPTVATVTGLEIRRVDGRPVESGVLQLTKGESARLGAYLTYSNGTAAIVEVMWTTSNHRLSIEHTPGQDSVTVRGVRAGEATISAAGSSNADDRYRTAQLTVEVTLPHRPVDPQFSDQYWRELVFNGWDVPGREARSLTKVLENTSPNFRIWVTGVSGSTERRVVSYMVQAIPGLVSRLTGESYRGGIEYREGEEYPYGRLEKGSIRIRVGALANYFICGQANIGADGGLLEISNRDICVTNDFFPHLFAHELGHAFGFYHVSDRSAVMYARQGEAYSDGPVPDNYNVQETYHARLAYEVGRGEPYIGWPLSTSAESGFSKGMDGARDLYSDCGIRRALLWASVPTGGCDVWPAVQHATGLPLAGHFLVELGARQR